MIYLKPMDQSVFNQFKITSQNEYAKNFATAEGVSLEYGLKNAAEQFSKLVPHGLETPCQLFFEALEEKTDISVGYLWLSNKEHMGRKITSINDIIIHTMHRGRGLGKALMSCVEHEAQKAGSSKLRLHVFYHNEVARNLYARMGFQPTNLDMAKFL